MQVEEQPSHSTVAVAEGMNGLEVEMHPGAEGERILSLNVSLFVLRFPRRHHVQDPFHSRRRRLHAPDPDVDPPPLPASALMPRNTSSCSSNAVVGRIGPLLRSRRFAKAAACWIVSSTSERGRFPTDFCSRRILSTSVRLRVFPSIAFVPHVLSAPVRFQTPSGRESRALRVSNSARRGPNMSSLIQLSRIPY